MFIGTAIVVVLVITLVNGVLVRGFLAGASAVFQPQNTTTRAGVEQPPEPERSGSPASFAAWDTLGFQGRNFVGTGPDAAELDRSSTAARPRNPSAIYAGLQTADTDRGPDGACCSRSCSAPVPSTASCWSSSPPPAPAGSIRSPPGRSSRCTTATPRWSACSTPICRAGSRSSADRQKSVEAGRAMIDAIHDRWLQLAAGPPAQAGALRREPRVRWPGRARSAICPTSRRWASPRCCGWGRPTRARCGRR